jgi:hypothetical protein
MPQQQGQERKKRSRLLKRERKTKGRENRERL